jgi:hypothetical protein
LYNIESENPFEGRLLVCKVAKRVTVFPSEWEVWKRFLQGVVSFSRVKKLVFEIIKFSKLESKSMPYVFLGYYEGTKAYRLMCVETKRIIKS